MKKETIVIISLILIVVLVIIGIKYLNQEPDINGKVISCIASKSRLIVSPTCGYCAKQKEVLNDYLNEFEIININNEIIEEYGVTRIPSWIINEQVYVGVKTIQELSELTNCNGVNN